MSPSCDQVRALVPELALGIADAGERAAALEHVDSCPGCREALAELSKVVDDLLLLAPEAEPPLGFESRVMNRIAAEDARPGTVVPLTTRPPRRRRRRLAMTLAAAAIVIGATTAVVVNHNRNRAPVVATDRFATLHDAAGADVGKVIIHGGTEPWVFMAVRNGDGTEYRCELVLGDGTKVPIGSLKLTNGRGSWGGPTTVNVSKVRWVHVVDSDGSVFANATI